MSMTTVAEFRESLRYEYPELNANSLVVDLGGYRGDWTAVISERYGARIFVFEPVAIFAAAIASRFSANPQISVIEAAVSDHWGRQTLYQREASSTFYCHEPAPEVEVAVMDVAAVFQFEAMAEQRKRGRWAVELLKLNIEGEEFRVLPRLLDTGLIRECREIQVQFHEFYPEAKRCYGEIRRRLLETHQPTWEFAFVHENWKCK